MGETRAPTHGESLSAVVGEKQADGRGCFRRRDEGLSEDVPLTLDSRDREQSVRQRPGGGDFQVGRRAGVNIPRE